jgi:hypothetical protein
VCVCVCARARVCDREKESERPGLAWSTFSRKLRPPTKGTDVKASVVSNTYIALFYTLYVCMYACMFDARMIICIFPRAPPGDHCVCALACVRACVRARARARVCVAGWAAAAPEPLR